METFRYVYATIFSITINSYGTDRYLSTLIFLNPQWEESSSWKWQISALTSENSEGVSKAKPTSPRRTASMETGPHWFLSVRPWKYSYGIFQHVNSISLSWSVPNLPELLPDCCFGVASMHCQPPYPWGRSVRAINTSVHAWKVQIESWLSPSGPPLISSPNTSKYLSIERVWLVSCAEMKLVTGRDGIPKARQTKHQQNPIHYNPSIDILRLILKSIVEFWIDGNNQYIEQT